MSHACHRFWKCYKTLTFCSLLTRSTIPCACHAKRRLNVQKWREHVVSCTFLTSKCASRHNGMHIFDISTPKSGPYMVCFVHFDFEMCFRHLNFQKWSEPGVFCAFWLRNVLRASDWSAFVWHRYDVYSRRKFRFQTSDNMDRWKAEMGRVREKRRVEERRSEKRKSQKKEDADARRKVAKHCVFPMICGSGGSKSRLAKAAGAEPSGQMRDEKVHAVGTPPVILSTLFNITFQCCLVTLNM